MTNLQQYALEHPLERALQSLPAEQMMRMSATFTVGLSVNY